MTLTGLNPGPDQGWEVDLTELSMLKGPIPSILEVLFTS